MAKNLTLAREVKKLLDASDAPHEMTVNEIASQLEVPPEDVIEVLDEHAVGADGKVTHQGPGQGGGWATTPGGDEPAAA